MPAAVPLRTDFDGPKLPVLARGWRNAAQVRRLLAMAKICYSGSRSEAAHVGGVGLQSIRDWVLRFNAGGLAALIDTKTAGRKPKLGAAELEALAWVIEESPRPAVQT